jgi:hypothetical protein
LSITSNNRIAWAASSGVGEMLMGFIIGPKVQSRKITDETRWDEKAGLRRDAVGSQIIDALEAQEIKETGNEED